MARNGTAQRFRTQARQMQYSLRRARLEVSRAALNTQYADVESQLRAGTLEDSMLSAGRVSGRDECSRTVESRDYPPGRARPSAPVT